MTFLVSLLLALTVQVHHWQVPVLLNQDVAVAAVTVPEGVTSSYLSIAGPDGDMALALSDMSIYERLTPDWLAAVLPVLMKICRGISSISQVKMRCSRKQPMILRVRISGRVMTTSSVFGLTRMRRVSLTQMYLTLR